LKKAPVQTEQKAMGARTSGMTFLAVASSNNQLAELASLAKPENVHLVYAPTLVSLYTILADAPIDILLIDANFCGKDILDVLPEVRKSSEHLVVMVVIEKGRSEALHKELLRSVFDVVVWPLQQPELNHKFQNALEHVALNRQVNLLERRRTMAEQEHAVSPTQKGGEVDEMHLPLRQFFEASVHLSDMHKLGSLLLSSLTDYFLTGKGVLVILDQEKERLEVQSSRGVDEEFLRAVEFSLSSGIYSWLRRTNRVFLPKQPDPSTLEASDAAFQEAKLLHAEVVVPLRGQQQPIGFLSLGNKFTGEPYAKEDIRKLFFLAKQAGTAIENASLLQKTRRMALHDELTQLYNRHYWKMSLETEIERSRRYGRPLSVAIFDIDRFKQINDTLGHAKGDEVLKGLARFMIKSSRQTDIVGRYGGEEFIVILPETTEEFAFLFSERLRMDVEQKLGNEESEECIHPGLTISGGVSSSNRKDDSAATLLERSDSALYSAKREGRNRIHQIPPSNDNSALA
jgi:diguanylate cyclase (GGDEF)-like protein